MRRRDRVRAFQAIQERPASGVLEDARVQRSVRLGRISGALVERLDGSRGVEALLGEVADATGEPRAEAEDALEAMTGYSSLERLYKKHESGKAATALNNARIAIECRRSVLVLTNAFHPAWIAAAARN